MFQITEYTEAHVASVTNRQEVHGEEKVPAVSIGLELTEANTILDQIDPNLRTALYKARDDQEDLPGVEPSTPVLRCNSLDRVVLATAHEGWTLCVDDNIDDSQPMTFGKCKVDKFSVEAKQGGSIILRLRVGTSDIDAERLGKLGMHNGQSIWVTLKAPEKQPETIDGTGEQFKADHPDAGDLFAAEHGDTPAPDGGEGSDSEGGETDATERVPQEGDPDYVAWPFPGTATTEAPPQSVTIERSQPQTRTARGRERMKDALAGGAQL